MQPSVELLLIVLFAAFPWTTHSNEISDNLRICITDGCLQGKHFDGLEAGFRGYLGVPYAKAPVGDLRFRNPQPVEPWSGDYDATYERSKCVQKNDLSPNEKVEGSEDCLYMNVFVPESPKRESLAVLMYIHGGGYFAGSSSMGEFGPDRFMNTREVILVVIQYRLGVFGFLSTGDGAATGNFGLKDQTAALRWINQNIAKFGGDPEKVMIFGQSAGGAAVQMHMLSPLSRGLFSTAVVMSGSTLGFWTWPIKDPLSFAREQAAAVGIESAETLSSEKLVDALRNVDAVELGASIDKLKFWYLFPLTPYHTVVENFVDNETFIAEDPRSLWQQGKYAQIPWMAGYVPNEGAFSSLVILSNSTLLQELNENSKNYIPRILGCKETEKSRQLIRDKFFPGGTEDHWITKSNANNLKAMFSEAFITYALQLSVKQHLNLDVPNKSSVQMYYFAFESNHSYSQHFLKSDGYFGVCHSDDLSYLFRATDLFADFQEHSPEAAMAERLVRFYVQFAYEGVDESLDCQQDCKKLEFHKSKNEQHFVDELRTPALDEEMLAFWNELYDQE